MARPGNNFPSERRGTPCGGTWSDPLRVSGRLSATNGFGEQISVDLPAVAEASDLRGGQGRLSWDGPFERRVRESLEGRIQDTLEDLIKFRDTLGERNADAIEGLLRMAVDNLDVVTALHEKWRPSWPMSRRYYNETECRTPQDMGKVFSGGFNRCPDYATIVERDRDRESIVRRYIDTAHAIRCAEWGMWRVVLYQRALAQWRRSPMGSGPGDLAPTPPPPPSSPLVGGGLVARPPVLPPPTPPAPEPDPTPELPDFPPDLGTDFLPPPPPPEPEPDLGEPPGLGQGMPEIPEPSPPDDDEQDDDEAVERGAKSNVGMWVGVGAVAAVAVGVGAYAWGRMRKDGDA